MHVRPRIHARSFLCILACPLSWSLLSSSAEADTAAATARPEPGSWPEAMLAARVQLRQQGGSEIQLDPWHTTGPLPAKKLAESLFPESGVSLDARDEKGRALWEARPGWVDGQVHDLPGGGSSSTYLFRTITAKAPCQLGVSLGSDDGLEVFLRGRKILSADVARGAGADQDRAVLDLEAGPNGLLLKIYNRTGQHGFYFSAGRNAEADLWGEIARRFPDEASWMVEDAEGRHLGWFHQTGGAELEKAMILRALAGTGAAAEAFRGEYEGLVREGPSSDDPRWLSLHARCAQRRHRLRAAMASVQAVNFPALRLAIRDLAESYPERYPRAADFLERLDAYEELLARSSEAGAPPVAEAMVEEIVAFRQEALLANPLLDFDRLLLVRRKAGMLGLPQNWQGNCALPRSGYEDAISVLSPVRPEGRLQTLYRPEKDLFVGDVDLHFDADRMLVSMPGSHDRWQIWEIRADGTGLRQVTPGTYPDVDSYDPCYLPDGRIVFASTACFQGVPCVGGGNTVANLYRMNSDGTGIRQLCFDQDHDWCPTVLNNGRILYSRWEYSDSPHYFTRVLFHMNPDGTDQKEYYASNSMWPNSIFYARPIPGDPTEVVTVISGHHGVPRMGELVLFDPALGRHQATGAVQRIPGHGKRVEPIIRDTLVDGSWPKFLHPYPLSGKYFLVSCQPTPGSSWGIYLVDVFDNMLLLKEEPGWALFEPIPFRKTPRPPVIPDAFDPTSREAVVYLADVYAGDGLQGVPRGTVKKLRVYELHYAYPSMGGHIEIGIDGPWDARRILGTVDVEEDGSASFRVPANIPISVQPLDADGRALQVMRSWFAAMPGEKLSCVGCHESQNTVPPAKLGIAAQREPSAIHEWYGPARGFSFEREVQPVLTRHCAGCHNPERKDLPDFTPKEGRGWRNFTPSYVALHPYVRRPGPESDYFLQQPLEFHASTSELVQMLEAGHHGVRLDREAWDRLVTWIDLNVPDHGTWHEQRRGHSGYEKRRLEMRTLYANRPEDPEEIPAVDRGPAETAGPETARQEPGEGRAPEESPERPEGRSEQVAAARLAGAAPASFDPAEARRLAVAAGLPERLKFDLSPDLALELVLIPAGELVVGETRGASEDGADETRDVRVQVDRPFYLAVCEISNAQYALFRPDHDSAYISMTAKDHSERGHPINGPRQPVVRISWDEAMAFCEWLSARTGKTFTLPTEAQWEWACRAGSAAPFSYGDLDADFSRHANLADASLARLAQGDSPQWHPRDARFDDGAMVTAEVGRYQPNAWGLHDMHGNVAEWTRSPCLAPASGGTALDEAPGKHAEDPVENKVVRGGSWYDRPKQARAGYRLPYRPWQRVFDVGFRVILESETTPGVRVSSRADR